MKDFCLLDIQTTGLFWRTSTITYIGLAYQTNEGWNYCEWYPENEEEEYDALFAFATTIDNYSTFYTYNGTGFDIPYLSHKMRAYGIDNPLSSLEHLDFMRILSPYKTILRFPSMKQIDVELLLGYNRQENSLGAPSYNEDIKGMTVLLSYLPLIDFFHGEFTDCRPTFIDQGDKKELILCATGLKPLYFPFSYTYGPYYLTIDKSSLKLKITLYEGECKLFFPNHKDYYYLPLEDCAIHKSIGTFVDKEHRKQAKAATCYQKLRDTFLPQPNMRFTPCFQDTYDNPSYYLSYRQEWIQQEENLHQYIQEVISYLVKSPGTTH